METVLVFADDSGRIQFWYSDFSQLRESFRAQGVEVSAAQMEMPETDPWMRAVPFLSGSEVTWMFEPKDPSEPEVLELRLAQHELPGQHQPINP